VIGFEEAPEALIGTDGANGTTSAGIRLIRPR
jgi:hypothetical protein